MSNKHRQPDATVETTRSDTSVTCLSSQQLFAGKQEVLIQHNGQLYRLRITRQNKLILTK